MSGAIVSVIWLDAVVRLLVAANLVGLAAIVCWHDRQLRQILRRLDDQR